ncbi:probable phospholipase A2 homolog 2 [Phragmites australis]|uniref:probable phospholipase A2 homolog 2 n=1 Tax=Phragmites australis TaxID=29695 RepID=UPI002D789787|nr:probable phospholipase A2 homolog 2 [Phragmites australis]
MGTQIGGCGGLTDCRRLRRQRPRLLPLLPLLLLTAVADHQLAAANIFGGDTNTASQCSRTCESEHCTAAPLMRYGKYCGVSYTGCPGEAPCDALDACCMLHDACVQATDNDYLNMWCNQSLLDCVATARPSTATFEGNRCNVTEVAGRGGRRVQFAKRILHKP